MIRQKNNEGGSFHVGLWSLSALLSLGAALSVLGLVSARRRGDEKHVAVAWAVRPSPCGSELYSV